jgi:hypothetical protein
MREERMPDRQPDKKRIVEDTTAARQGVTGHNVRYVLGISLFTAVIALGAIWILFYGH